MCVPRKIEECCFGSTVEVDGLRGIVLKAHYNTSDEGECVSISTSTGVRLVPWGTEVVSHHLSPAERLARKIPSPCEVRFLSDNEEG